jgi:hypothetical protein
VADLLLEIEADSRQLRFFLDFHSTKRNLFYTFPDDATEPPGFFTDWFERVRPRLVDYPFTNENGRPTTPGVGKNYINERYGIAAATYEVGDETDRAETAAAAIIFAEELMQLLLDEPDT